MNNDNLLPIVTKLLSSEDMTVKAALEVLNYIPSNEGVVNHLKRVRLQSGLCD